MSFPKGEKYVSLLRDAEDAEAQAHAEAERLRLRRLVKQQLAESAVVTEAHEGQGAGVHKVRRREPRMESGPAAHHGYATNLIED